MKTYIIHFMYKMYFAYITYNVLKTATIIIQEEMLFFNNDKIKDTICK